MENNIVIADNVQVQANGGVLEEDVNEDGVRKGEFVQAIGLRPRVIDLQSEEYCDLFPEGIVETVERDRELCMIFRSFFDNSLGPMEDEDDPCESIEIFGLLEDEHLDDEVPAQDTKVDLVETMHGSEVMETDSSEKSQN